MKLSQKIALGFTILSLTGIIFYITRSKSDSKRMLKEIADEGYETANDVLFPGKKLKAKFLKYGPVIPN